MRGKTGVEKIGSKERLLELERIKGFLINKNPPEKIIHLSECYFSSHMNPEKKEGGIYFAKKIEDIVSSFSGLSFFRCFYCDPTIDFTEQNGKSIIICEREFKGLPETSTTMAGAQEYYYSRQQRKYWEEQAEELEESKEAGVFFIKLIFFLVFLFILWVGLWMRFGFIIGTIIIIIINLSLFVFGYQEQKRDLEV